MTILGVLIIIVGFILAIIFTPIIGMPGFFIGMGICFVGYIIKLLGENATINKNLKLLFKDGTIKGKSLTDIEKIMGVHTDVNVTNDDKRIYKWENLLEVVCNKDNVCKDVISCVYDYKKGNQNETTKK